MFGGEGAINVVSEERQGKARFLPPSFSFIEKLTNGLSQAFVEAAVENSVKHLVFSSVARSEFTQERVPNPSVYTDVLNSCQTESSLPASRTLPPSTISSSICDLEPLLWDGGESFPFAFRFFHCSTTSSTRKASTSTSPRPRPSAPNCSISRRGCETRARTRCRRSVDS